MWYEAPWDSQTLRPAETATMRLCLQRTPLRWKEFLSFEWRVCLWKDWSSDCKLYIRGVPSSLSLISVLYNIQNLHFALIQTVRMDAMSRLNTTSGLGVGVVVCIILRIWSSSTVCVCACTYSCCICRLECVNVSPPILCMNTIV